MCVLINTHIIYVQRVYWSAGVERLKVLPAVCVRCVLGSSVLFIYINSVLYGVCAKYFGAKF
jgi:hypothetical protein